MYYYSTTPIEKIVEATTGDSEISLKRAKILEKINLELSRCNNGFTAFIYGSTANGIAEEDGIIDICITSTNTSPSTSKNNSTIEKPEVFTEEDLYSFVIRIPGTLVMTVYSYAPFSYIVRNLEDNIRCDIRAENLLDIERTNLITEYLSLDIRIKPFIFALRKFVKAKEITDEKKGYLNSYTFTMIGLYFLIFVQDPPVIPCLHNLFGRECYNPVCRFKRDETVQRFTIKYHDCVSIKTTRSRNNGSELESIPGTTVWNGRNEKSVGDLLIEAFKWLASPANIIKPKTINPKNDPNTRNSNWEDNTVIFVDPFDFNHNIADSCSALGANIISKEFALAYNYLKQGYDFCSVLDPTGVARPIIPKLKQYGTYGRRN